MDIYILLLTVQFCAPKTDHKTWKRRSQASQTAALARSSSSLALAASSRSRLLRLISCSLIDRSYARCSSVLFGARIPNAPAIILPATAVCFSGRRAAAPGDCEDGERGFPYAAVAGDEDEVEACGEMGVGGGPRGPSFCWLVVLAGVGVVSGSEAEESASSSQESATTGGFVSFFVFGFGFGFRSDVEI